MFNIISMGYNIKLLFITCILIRLLLAYIAKKAINKSWRLVLVIFYAIISLGMFVQMFRKFRTNGAFGQKIWWGNYRQIHGTLWGLSAYFLYYNNHLVYHLLLLDTLIATVAHVYNRYL